MRSRSHPHICEFGGGFSTAYFLQQSWLHQLITVENDWFWFREVTNLLNRNGINSTKHLFSLRATKTSGLPGELEWSDSKKWQGYLDALENVEPINSIDLLISDGHVRGDVVVKYASQISPTGLIIVHDQAIEDFRPSMKSDKESDYFFLSCAGNQDLFRGARFLVFSAREESITQFYSFYRCAEQLMNIKRNSEIKSGRMEL